MFFKYLKLKTFKKFDLKIAIRLVAVPLATAMVTAMTSATHLKIQLSSVQPC